MPDEISCPNIIKRNHTFLTGIFIAINAISDAYLIVDGPDCVYKKIELFEKNHDFCTRIFDPLGRHRICSTLANVDNVIGDRHKEINNLIRKVAEYDQVGAVFVTSMPMVMLTGIQYNMLIREASEYISKNIIDVPYQSVDMDWLDGYGNVLASIAKNLNLQSNKRKPGTIAIIGYLFDRNEGDHEGNLAEISRWLESIGISLSSVWLCGSGFVNLKKAEEADLIVSLPYGRLAAQIISSKTGAEILELGLPFGIENTRIWITRIARHYGAEGTAQRFIDSELRQVMPHLEWLVPAYFQGKNITLGLDPFLADACISAFEDIDAHIYDCIVYGRSYHGKMCTNFDNVSNKYFDSDTYKGSSSICFALANSDCRQFIRDTYFVEFGFPSFGYHCLHRMPFFGIRGFTFLLVRIVGVLCSSNKRFP